MENILANCSVSISELKKNPSSLIETSEGNPIVILNHNKPTAYLIPAETYRNMLEELEDYRLGKLIQERSKDKKDAIEMTLDEL